MMPTTTTGRMRQIADDLYELGSYTSANSVHAITEQRDAMVAALMAGNYDEAQRLAMLCIAEAQE